MIILAANEQRQTNTTLTTGDSSSAGKRKTFLNVRRASLSSSSDYSKESADNNNNNTTSTSGSTTTNTNSIDNTIGKSSNIASSTQRNSIDLMTLSEQPIDYTQLTEEKIRQIAAKKFNNKPKDVSIGQIIHSINQIAVVYCIAYQVSFSLLFHIIYLFCRESNCW